MPLIQFNLPEHTDNKISYYKIAKNLKTKYEAIIEIVNEYFRQNPDFFERLEKENNELAKTENKS